MAHQTRPDAAVADSRPSRTRSTTVVYRSTWSALDWILGENATPTALSDLNRAAERLGQFVVALRAVGTDDAPVSYRRDHDEARISVRQALVAVAYKIITSTPKNHHARVIDLDKGTISQIWMHHQRQQTDRDQWGTDYQDNDLVFCKEDGSPVHPHTFSQAFERLIADLDVPKIRLHDRRHTHATIALTAGIQVKIVSERPGHESPAFTLKQYAHAIPGMQAEAAREIARSVSETST